MTLLLHPVAVGDKVEIETGNEVENTAIIKKNP